MEIVRDEFRQGVRLGVGWVVEYVGFEVYRVDFYFYFDLGRQLLVGFLGFF